jgi:pyruvate/2-oxoacid:ferredoxin oxidoreductase alpha subunit
MDGFILTHAYERVDMPDQAQVDRFLPPYEPRQVLDPDEPVTIGAMVGPEAFAEVRYLAHAKQMQALDLIPQVADEFSQVFGRDSGGLVKPYRLEDAETIVIALGSVLGTIKDTVDELRERRREDRRAGHHFVPPVPDFGHPRRDGACQTHRRDRKCFAVGIGGIVSRDVRSAVRNRPQPVLTVVAGLGGRAITKASLHEAAERRHRRQAGTADLPGPRLGHRQPGAGARKEAATFRPHGRKHPARPGPLGGWRLRPTGRPSGPTSWNTPSSSFTRPAPSPWATACWRPTSAACRPTPSATIR